MSSTLAHVLHTLQTTAHATYAAAYHQVIINSVIYLVVAALLLSLAWVTWYFLSKVYRDRKQDAHRPPYYDNGDLWLTGVFLIGIPIIVSIVLTLLALSHLLNPQWAATSLILINL